MSVHQDFVAQLDKLARWTGVPRLVVAETRVRNLRWLPLLPLALGLIGSCSFFAVPDARYYTVTVPVFAALFPSCLMLAVHMQSLGPLRQGTDADEREVQLRRDAFLFSFYIVGVIEMVAVPFFLAFAFMQHWTAALILVRTCVFFLNLFLLFMLLPTLYASWVAPVSRPEED